MNCIIVDDEPLARQEMQSLIEELSSFEILGKFSNAVKAVDFLRDNEVDIIFLDIEMPVVTGLEFARQISEKTLVIFTTAYPQYALRSYELDAIDYLLKPIDKERLEKAINKASLYKNLLTENTVKSTFEGNNSNFLFIKSDRRHHKLNYNDIVFVEGLKDYVIIHTKTQKLITAMNLKTIHQKLISNLFLRVSKSYVVNIDYVESFDNHTLYGNNFEIPLGEVYKKEFFNQYYKS